MLKFINAERVNKKYYTHIYIYMYEFKRKRHIASNDSIKYVYTFLLTERNSKELYALKISKFLLAKKYFINF